MPVPNKCIDVPAPAFANMKLFVRNQKDLVCFDMRADTTVPLPPSTLKPVVDTTVAAGDPDLVITDVTMDPPAPKAGDVVTFRAVVKNQGTIATPDGIVIGVRFLVDTPTPVIWSDNETASLAPGKTVAVRATGGTAGGTWTATAGAHTVTVIVDDIDRFTESKEDNNTLVKTLTVP
jgi:hypothetical protein